MYEAYWGLREKPFDGFADPRYYFPDESHQAALLKLRYAIENRRGGALLTGPSGTGKTMVLAMLRAMLAETFRPLVHVVFPQMTADELLAYLAAELAGSASQGAAAGVHESVSRIERFLAENARRGRHAVVAIDEAHLLDEARTLEALRLLMNFNDQGHPGLTLIVCGQTGLLPLMERTPQFEERLAVKCLLRPFTATETADYVRHRLQVAAAPRAFFEPDALVILQELTQGVPRRINRLCDLALLIGYAEELPSLGAAQLEAIFEELATVTPE